MWAYELGARNDYVLPPPLADLTGPAAATPLFALREIYVPATSAARRGRVHRVVEHFSDARSVLVYRGNAFPPAYRGNVFVADARANLIHRFVLRRGGPEFIAERPADEAGTEFLATTNAWVRPLQLTEGPDGALYILDLHREFLDAPATLPAAARKRPDAEKRSGRIYRVVPRFPTAARAPPGRAALHETGHQPGPFERLASRHRRPLALRTPRVRRRAVVDQHAKSRAKSVRPAACIGGVGRIGRAHR